MNADRIIPPTKRSRRLWLWIPLCFLFILLIVLLIWWLNYQGQLSPLDPNGKARQVVIAKGSDGARIADRLEEEGIIRSADGFNWYLRLNGKSGKLKAGTYSLSPAQNVAEIVAILIEGKEDMLRLTIPEGLKLEQIAQRIEEAGLGSKSKFLAACNEGDPKKRLPGEKLEGYLFPDTYTFPHGTSEEQLRDLMLDRFFAFWTAEREAAAKAGGRTRRQVVILASIVEREAMVNEERPIIAGIFLNRLRKGMMLQSCATVEYAIGVHRERLTIQDMKVDSPYNTYKYPGLPPGPICCPGAASLKAALEPTKTDYLFFVSRNDGTHQFSKTFGEHEKGRIEYQHDKGKKK